MINFHQFSPFLLSSAEQVLAGMHYFESCTVAHCDAWSREHCAIHREDIFWTRLDRMVHPMQLLKACSKHSNYPRFSVAVIHPSSSIHQHDWCLAISRPFWPPELPRRPQKSSNSVLLMANVSVKCVSDIF